MLIYAATLGVLGFDALLAGREYRHRLNAPAIAAVATALTVTTGLFVEIPADKIFTHITYDSLSLVHVVVFWIAAVAAAAIALCWRHIERRSVRIFTALAACCADGLRDLKHMRAAADIGSFHALLKKRKVDTLLVCPVYHPRFFKQDEALPAWLQPVDGMKFYKPDGNMPLLLRVMP